MTILTIIESDSSEMYKLPCVHIEVPDKAAHPRSLIRVFNERFMDSQEADLNLNLRYVPYHTG